MNKKLKGIKESRMVRIGMIIINSAPFALLISIVFFWYEQYNNQKDVDEMVSDMQRIESSLSTRYIGIFPDYLDKINNEILEPALTSKDTADIIIFEDVVFYGCLYNSAAYIKMLENLILLSSKGHHIMVAYYDNNKNMRGKMFREVIQESWLNQSDLAQIPMERKKILDDSTFLHGKDFPLRFNRADSIVNEKYFKKYRMENEREFKARINNILIPYANAKCNCRELLTTLDSIKSDCIDKPIDKITYADIYSMYNSFTDEITSFYTAKGIEMIPLDGYLTMSCWSNGEMVLFAFPGRYAADEIGFISSDITIINYINTMRDGLKNKMEIQNKK